MLLGDTQDWASRFVSIDERFLERVAVVWPNCMAALSRQAVEDEITINLVHHLTKDSVIRRICHWVEFQFEPSGTHSNGAKFSKGKIDIAVFLNWERELYVAYECKRLNVKHRGRRQSLAMPYVKEGMMRFMAEQYAEALNVGCMLGYVMDGDTPFALRKLKQAIQSYAPLGLATGPRALEMKQNVERFVTTHTRSAKPKIELRHALLKCAT